jgi:hypothetical protein
MRIGRLTSWLWAFVLCLPAAGVAQSTTAQTVGELGDKVKPGGSIFVTDRTGAQTEGRVLRLSPQELVLLADGKEQAIPTSRIGRVEKRDALWNGMLIGAFPSALVGAGAAGASCSPHCGRDVSLGMLVFGAMGAGVGAFVDSRIRGYSILGGPPLASANALDVPAPVTSLDQLWLRVRQGDTINVVTLNGQTVTGRFVNVSSSFVTLTVSGEHREIPSSDVRHVTRRGNRYRSGALWGGVSAGAMALLASASCSGDGCGNPLFMAMFSGSAGALWGAAIGAAIPKHPMVHESRAFSTVRVLPMMGSGRVGVALSVGRSGQHHR